MPRGRAGNVGDKTVNKNGYEYEKTEDRSWVASHTLCMERKLGRQLEPGEYVTFVPGVEKTPVTIDKLVLRRRGDNRNSNRQRIAQIKARIAELQAELDILEAEESVDA